MIDTLKIARRLEAANLPKSQAEAIAESIADIQNSDLATKADLSALRAEIHEGIGKLTITLWITQLSTVGIILVGVGLLVHFKL